MYKTARISLSLIIAFITRYLEILIETYDTCATKISRFLLVSMTEHFVVSLSENLSSVFLI